MALIALSGFASGAAPAMARAQTPAAVFTLTNADNGSTVHVAVGDRVQVQLSTTFSWGVTASNPDVLKVAPGPLPADVQAAFTAAAAGSAAINATGTKVCPPNVPCPAIAAAFSATVIVLGGPSATAHYGAGWNLVSGPAGTVLPVDAYAWDPVAGSYASVPAGTPLTAGHGYWAYFSVATDVALSPASQAAATISAPAGAWVLVGNPSAAAPAAVSGADLVYTWSPRDGSYEASTALAPGAGAWALSYGGGQITVAAR